jgi:hypothetical protein
VSERSAAPVGILLGVLLLGAVAGLGIALPKATDDGSETEQARAAIELPDELPYGLVAQDRLAGEPADRYTRAQTSAVEGLEEIYGDDAAVRGYATEDGRAQATITVLDRAPGLFDPHGPPVDPDLYDLERMVYELRRIGDTVCDLFWGQSVPTGQRVDDGAEPASMQCQLGDGDRTIELFASGLSVDEGVDVLSSLVGQDQ